MVVFLTVFDETYDCPEEILKGKNMTSTPVPVYYVVDDTYPDTYPDSYPDSISNTFRNGANHRGRPDGHVYDEPEADLSRRPYVVMDNPNGMELFDSHYVQCDCALKQN